MFYKMLIERPGLHPSDPEVPLAINVESTSDLSVSVGVFVNCQPLPVGRIQSHHTTQRPEISGVLNKVLTGFICTFKRINIILPPLHKQAETQPLLLAVPSLELHHGTASHCCTSLFYRIFIRQVS